MMRPRVVAAADLGKLLYRHLPGPTPVASLR